MRNDKPDGIADAEESTADKDEEDEVTIETNDRVSRQTRPIKNEKDNEIFKLTEDTRNVISQVIVVLIKADQTYVSANLCIGKTAKRGK